MVLKGAKLTVEDVVRVARGRRDKVELHPDALEKVKKCRAMLEEKIQAREIMYGVNTGIGEFSEVVLDDDQIQDFQRYLIYNHAAGMGDPLPEQYVRAAMLGRSNVLAHGNSGCRPEILHTLIAMLNQGVTLRSAAKGRWVPAVTSRPCLRSHCLCWARDMLIIKAMLYDGKTALEKAGIPVPGLQARDGLATINGSNLLTGMSALMLFDTNRWLKQAEIAAAMSLEALKGQYEALHSQAARSTGFCRCGSNR